MTTRFAESVRVRTFGPSVQAWNFYRVMDVGAQFLLFYTLQCKVEHLCAYSALFYAYHKIGYYFLHRWHRVGWWEDGEEGEEPPLRSFECAKGSISPLYSQLFRKLLMPMKTLADWRERRNDVHSVGLRARTWVGGRDVYVDLSMCYSDRRESWSSCPSSPLGTSLSRMKQSAASLGWSLSRLSRGTLCLSGTVMF